MDRWRLLKIASRVATCTGVGLSGVLLLVIAALLIPLGVALFVLEIIWRGVDVVERMCRPGGDHTETTNGGTNLAVFHGIEKRS